MIIQVTCALIFKEKKLLITQRSEKMNHPFRWEFPGGKMLSGETPEKCLKREIKEELKIDVEIRKRLPGVEQIYGDKTIRMIPFVCEIKSGRIALTEHSQYSWVKSNEIKNFDLLEADQQIIRGMIDGNGVSLF